MKEELLRTPAGVRDICGEEFIRKECAERAVKRVMKQYGYLQIKTPTFEYFDIFNSERGTVSSRDMYKFTDRDGETCVLRPDVTPQIARCVAKYHRNDVLPVRLFYRADTFVNNDGYQGKLKEITQIGAELVNASGVTADAEMIALMIDCFLSLGLTEFQIEVGNAEFFKALTSEAGFSESETEELKDLIEAKNLFGVEELLSKKNIDNALKEIFTKLPLQFGSIDFVREFKKSTENVRALSALNELEEIYEKLKVYGKEAYVSFDLGMLTKYEYYTGVVFKAYTHKTGEPIGAGGRYDSLLAQFGKPASAIGIAIYVDYAIAAMNRQGIQQKVVHDATLLLYEDGFEDKAIEVADSLRADKLKITVLKHDPSISDEEYEAYAHSILAGGILYIDNTKSIRIKDLESGETHEKSL
jgi:ATP phosphoribosyltransferase regulatory subunit